MTSVVCAESAAVEMRTWGEKKRTAKKLAISIGGSPLVLGAFITGGIPTTVGGAIGFTAVWLHIKRNPGSYKTRTVPAAPFALGTGAAVGAVLLGGVPAFLGAVAAAPLCWLSVPVGCAVGMASMLKA